MTFDQFIGVLSTSGGGGTPQGAAPAQMNTNVMNFYLNYTARDKEGNLVVCNLPKDWIELFKRANVRPKELKDPETVIFLLELMDKHAAKVKAEQGGGGELCPTW